MKRGHSLGMPTRAFLGIALAVLGAMLLLSALEIGGEGLVGRWYPLLFVLVGVWALLRNGFQRPVLPIIMIVVAGAVMLGTWEVLEGAYFWAIALIVGGLVLIFTTSRRRRRRSSKRVKIEVDTPRFEAASASDFEPISASDANASTFTSSTTMASEKRSVQTDNLSNGDISVTMGSVELDLRNSQIRQRPATLNVVITMGEAKIYVPADWHVVFQSSTTLAATNDNRTVQPSRSGEPDLIITGSATIGEININN